MRFIWTKIKFITSWFLKSSWLIKLTTLFVILGLSYFGFTRIGKGIFTQKPQYQTAQVKRGNLIITVSASGQVTEANSATVDTQASGVVNKIYVKNGQKVKSGDKIAELELDLVGKQRAASAWSSYQSAKNNLETAKVNYYSLHSTLLKDWKTYMDLAQSALYENSDKTPNIANRQLPEFISTQDDWLLAEAKYKQQESIVAAAKTALNNAWLSYQRTSPVIHAPISGTVTGLALQVGSVLVSQSNTSGTATAQKIASIKTDAPPIIQVNLSQVDTPKVKIGDKATLIFDAFADKTYTGEVISIDTIGTISSGVTTYPAIIKMDLEAPEIFSNMTVNANIITDMKENVIIVPSNSVAPQNDNSTVRVLRNGKIEEVIVETGLRSATEVEITSGLSEGETVITGSVSPATTRRQTQSPFGSFGGGGVFFRR